MHINDTGIKRMGDKNMLVNIQVPSLAAYIPNYKILTSKKENKFKVETIVLKYLPRYDELFPLYAKEYDVRERAKKISGILRY